MERLPFEINWTVVTSYCFGAFILSLPTWFSAISTKRETRRARLLAEDNAKKLEVVHTLVNSQSEKLNIAIQCKAAAEGELKGRADAAAEQAAAAIATPQDKEHK